MLFEHIVKNQQIMNPGFKSCDRRRTLYKELYILIYDFLSFKSKLHMRIVSREFKSFTITDLNDLKYKYTIKLTDEILNQNVYRNLLKLNMHGFDDKKAITSLNHFTKLKVLYVGHFSCTISTDMINNLINLEELYMCNNKHINDLNTLKSLKILEACCDCGLGDSGIKKLNLIQMDINDNPRITDLNHMTSLQILRINGICGVDNHGIRRLTNLIDLECNRRISDLNHLTSLKKLIISYNASILDLNGLISLTELDISYCPNIDEKGIQNLHLIKLTMYGCDIIDVSFMTSLRILCAGDSFINDLGLTGLNLIELNVSKCSDVTDLQNMTTLKKLNISVERCMLRYSSAEICGVGDQKLPPFLETLDASNNSNVSNLNHLTHLTSLDISGISGVGPHGIDKLNLKHLCTKDNEFFLGVGCIGDCNH